MKEKTLPHFAPISFVLGAILIIVGAALWLNSKDISGWLVGSGGLIMAISFIISSLGRKEALSLRARRLERMQLFSSLLYLVAGGFMIQKSGYWLPIFAVGTIFFVYSAFVKDKPSSK